jgi:hypothetical protein
MRLRQFGDFYDLYDLNDLNGLIVWELKERNGRL